MSGLFKWIFAFIGFVVAGFRGGFLGLILGSLIDSLVSKGESPKKKNPSVANEFKNSLLALIACIMKADGSVKKIELDVVKRFLLTNFGEQGALDALAKLKELLNTDINEVQVASRVNLYMNYSSKLQLLYFLFEIAKADGAINQAELILLQRISNLFNITTLDFESIRAPYFKTQDVHWAYKVLEIEPSATDNEVKKAYRVMAKKYHPDKLNDLGQEIKKTATEKFRTVNEAYESIKKQRGFS